MRAAVLEKPGMENLRVMNVDEPRPGPNEVLIRVKYAGINPVDYFVISRGGKPMPHIPGAEFSGVVESLGMGVDNVSIGDEVIIYNRLFDGNCRYCLRGMEEVCINGGIIGVVTNGGFAEYAVVPARNVVKLPRGVNLEEATTYPVGALTAWHMVVSRAGVKPGELVVIFGATGNVGVYAVQFAKMSGATVIAVTRRVKAAETTLRSLGADHVVSPTEVESLVRELSGGVGADVVVDTLGQATWGLSYNLVGRYGRWVTAGALSGGDVNLNIPSLYGKEATLLGSTGGNREELQRILQLASMGRIKAPIYARYSLDRIKDAFEAMWKSEDRVGKVLLAI